RHAQLERTPLRPVGAYLDQSFLGSCSACSVSKRAAWPDSVLASASPAGKSSPSGSIRSQLSHTPPSRRFVIPFLRAVLIRRRGILLEVVLNPLPLFGRHSPAPAVAAVPGQEALEAALAGQGE